jgi:hypothetical protein
MSIQRILGYKRASHIKTSLCFDALAMANKTLNIQMKISFIIPIKEYITTTQLTQALQNKTE